MRGQDSRRADSVSFPLLDFTSSFYGRLRKIERPGLAVADGRLDSVGFLVRTFPIPCHNLCLHFY